MLDAINRRLKAAKMRVQVQLRGDSLYLSATLPPKPGSGKTKPYQQRIALGIKASAEGFKQAELAAKELDVQLTKGLFKWEQPQEPSKELTTDDAVALFEQHYFEQRGRTGKTETTFDNYADAFRRLPKGQLLTPKALIEAIETQKPNTRGRQAYAQALKMLANHFSIELDISKLKGNYSPKKVNPKTLPSDLEIQEAVKLFTYEPYKWVYGMMAAYGLRNHEVFFIDHDLLIKEGICHVLAGKRHDGKVWPLYPEWVDYFDLKNIRLPDIHGKTHSDYGERVSRAFNRAEIPFTPYALRHCWARRAIEMGLDSQLAAKQMRHAHSIHVTIYAAWLDDEVHKRAYDRILDNPNRPKPPGV